MSYNPAEATGPGNWPPVDSLTSLNEVEKKMYSRGYLFAGRVHTIIIALPVLDNVNITSESKWNSIMAMFQLIHPNEPGSAITQYRNFRAKLGRAYKIMRGLIARDQRAMNAFTDEESSTSELSSHSDLDSEEEGEGTYKTEKNLKVSKEAGITKGVDVKQGITIAKGYGVKENKGMKATVDNKVEPGKTVQSPSTIPKQSATIIHAAVPQAKETSTDPYHNGARLRLSFGIGLQSSSYVVCQGNGLLTMTTDCSEGKLHQVRQLGEKCIHCGRIPL